MRKKVYLISSGMGSPATITHDGLDALKMCDELYAPRRIAENFIPLCPNITVVEFGQTVEKVLASSANVIGVMVSGDTGFFSAAGKFNRELQETCEVVTLCGINSMQYLCSRFGVSYEGVISLSLHGRMGSALGAVAYNERVFLLTGGGIKAHDVIGELVEAGLGDVEVMVGENMSALTQRFFQGKASDLATITFEDLTSLLIINKNYVDSMGYFKDDDFTRGAVPMTKEAVRRLCVGELAPTKTDVVYDIGAGTGSVACEIARKASLGMVYAIEKEDEGISLIKLNRKKLGTYNVKPVAGVAPDVLAGLPVADLAFIGGSGGNLEDIINFLISMNPSIKIVITAITIETLSRATDLFKSKNIDMTVSCINASCSRKVGGYHMLVAQNPVYIITGANRGKA